MKRYSYAFHQGFIVFETVKVGGKIASLKSIWGAILVDINVAQTHYITLVDINVAQTHYIGLVNINAAQTHYKV